MEKKTISVHALTVHVYTIVVVLLLLLVAILGLKYLHLKLAVKAYTISTMWQNMQGKPNGWVSDYGQIIATTITMGDKPLYQQPATLENYVISLSKNIKRDIVVLDNNRKVLADSVAVNVGTGYAYDKNHEVNTTMADGVSRIFLESSNDYPNGITEVAVALKDSTGKIVGAVLVSVDPVTK